MIGHSLGRIGICMEEHTCEAIIPHINGNVVRKYVISWGKGATVPFGDTALEKGAHTCPPVLDTHVFDQLLQLYGASLVCSRYVLHQRQRRLVKSTDTCPTRVQLYGASQVCSRYVLGVF